MRGGVSIFRAWRMSRWGFVISVRCRKVPAGPAKVRPGVAAGVLGDAGEEEGQPAQEDVGADAVFPAVVDGAEVDDLLHVAPSALDFEELLVPGGDIFR